MSVSYGVVVVTHRSEHVLEACLASLRLHAPDASVVVVDDASPEGPPSVPADVDLLVQPSNRGFGAACNRGAHHLLRTSSPDVLVLLNPDVRLTGPSFAVLAEAIAADHGLGVATGTVVDRDGVAQPSSWGRTSLLRAVWAGTGWRVPDALRTVARRLPAGAGTSSRGMLDGPRDVDGHVLGGAMAVGRRCWEDLGGFDETFHLYWEDADLCLRARSAGHRVALVATPPIVHHGGDSSVGVGDRERWDWYVEGARRFGATHLTRAGTWCLLAALRAGAMLGGRGRRRRS